VETPRGLEGAKRQERESSALLDASPAGARRIVLDEYGKQLTSKTFSQTLQTWRDDGVGDTAFFIGGADGHGPAIAHDAHLKMAFGTATWPHMLVRAMLCEQIYRAMTILSGHPYHRS